MVWVVSKCPGRLEQLPKRFRPGREQCNSVLEVRPIYCTLAAMHGGTLGHRDLLHNPSAVEPWPADQFRKGIPFFNQLLIDNQLINLIKIQHSVNEFQGFIAVVFFDPKPDTNINCFTVYLFHFRYLRILFDGVVLMYTYSIDIREQPTAAKPLAPHPRWD